MKFLFIVLAGASLLFADSISIRETCIDFVLHHEGGRSTLNSVEYNYGFSGKYHGTVESLTVKTAREKYRKFWQISGAGSYQDSIYALFYFDTYVLFNPTAARSLMVSASGYDSFLMNRLQLHIDNVKELTKKKYKKKYDYLKTYMYSYSRRISDLRDLAIYWNYKK